MLRSFYEVAATRTSLNALLLASRCSLACIALSLTWSALDSDAEEKKPDNYPWISTLDAGDWETKLWGDRKVRKNGSRLMKLDKGLHLLDHEITPENDVLITIHGFAARGFEWVYPLQTLDTEDTDTYFFRWGWARRTELAEKLFLTEFKELQEERGETFTSVRIVAHSCGGVVAVSVIESLPKEIAFDIHIVASPVGGLGVFTVCDADVPEKIPTNVTVTQWKTQQHLDSVYLYFPWDPQDMKLDSVKIIELPERYRGKRLGHVRSLSWVADQVAKGNGEDATVSDATNDSS